MNITLNKKVIDFLVEHELFSQSYTIICKEFVVELNRLINWLDSEVDEKGNYNSYFQTIVHSYILDLLVYDHEIIYIDLSKADDYSQNIFMEQTIKKMRDALLKSKLK